MGSHMAANLLKHGKKLTVFDVNAASVASLVTKGAHAASSPAEVARSANTIITMLPSSPHVRQVYLDDEHAIIKGLLERKEKVILIDSSTIDPNVTRLVASTFASKFGDAIEVVDAPVSGGVGGAESGSLTFMVGSRQSVFEDVKSILQFMGKNIVYCGESGTGQVAKVCNNLILGISMAAVAESFHLGVSLGMDPKILASIVNTSSGRCWSSETYNPVPGVMANVPSSRGYTGGFAVELMKKDIGLALEAAKSASINLKVANSVNETYEAAAKDFKGKDFSVIYEYLKKN